MIPAVKLDDWGLASAYLVSFCAMSTLTMGVFAAGARVALAPSPSRPQRSHIAVAPSPWPRLASARPKALASPASSCVAGCSLFTSVVVPGQVLGHVCSCGAKNAVQCRLTRRLR